ncbi:MAG: serine/threonine protein kinase [Lentisphaerae bacterium]|nr:serine/threonine protein kinase [Lentisphaerota bacterium]
MKIPGFSILEKIGEGGMATVWKAHQVSLDRIVAIKILNPNIASDENEVIEFINEARSAAKIKHPNIIQIYDVAKAGGRYYFVMEYVAGDTVAQILKKKNRIPQKDAIKIARCVAEALQNAWNNFRVIHRDVKPDNIMIDADGTVKLADLGLSKRMADPATLSTMTQTNTIEGTPNYMSPESVQCSNKQDFRADIYSLGATLYHMVTGNIPFAGLDFMQVMQKHLDSTLPNPTTIIPGITLATSSLISRMMMKQPEDRFQSWEETILAMKRATTGRVILSTQRHSASSTIEPIKPRNAPSTTRNIKTPQQINTTIPIWIHPAALLPILLWWFGLGFALTRLPPATAYMPVQTIHRRAPVSSSPAPAAKAQRQIVAPQEDSENNIDTVQTTNDDANLAAIKTELAQHMYSHEFTLAKAIIDNELEYVYSADAESELNLIKKIIDDVSRINDTIELAFRKKIGEKVKIVNAGKEYWVRIKNVSAGEVTATMDVKIGSRFGTKTVTFAISQLDPIERSKWLGDPITVADHVQKLILHLEAGDFDTAKTLSAKCGYLSDAFVALIENN